LRADFCGCVLLQDASQHSVSDEVRRHRAIKEITGIINGYEQRITKRIRLYLWLRAARDVAYADVITNWNRSPPGLSADRRQAVIKSWGSRIYINEGPADPDSSTQRAN